MIAKKTWNRILIAAILLVVFVIIILALYVIPTMKANVANPMREEAVNILWFFLALHLIVLAELIYSRIFSFSEGHFENGFLVAAGFIALFLGLLLSDGGFFVCVGCDLITAILAFIARYFRGHLKTGAEV
jgi:magnesium-transporting ATPase (P-type)